MHSSVWARFFLTASSCVLFAQPKALTITYQVTSPSTPQRTLLVTDSYRADGSVLRQSSLSGEQLSEKLPRVASTPASCEAALGPNAVCHPLADDRILGVRVQRATLKLQNADDRVVEFYLAPELGYLQLKRVTTRAGQVVSEVTAVALVR